MGALLDREADSRTTPVHTVAYNFHRDLPSNTGNTIYQHGDYFDRSPNTLKPNPRVHVTVSHVRVDSANQKYFSSSAGSPYNSYGTSDFPRPSWQTLNDSLKYSPYNTDYYFPNLVPYAEQTPNSYGRPLGLRTHTFPVLYDPQNPSPRLQKNFISTDRLASSNFRRARSIDWTNIPYRNRRGRDPNNRKRKKSKVRPFCCSPVCFMCSTLLVGFLVAATAGILIGLLLKTPSAAINCGATCVNQSWTRPISPLAQWLLDDDYSDYTSTYNATPINGPTLSLNAYVGKAVFLDKTAQQWLSAPYVPLYMSSFTVEAWISARGFGNPLDHAIAGLCPTATPHNCLFFTVRKTTSSRHLYFGFYGSDDLMGTLFVKNFEWVHVAFVFDNTTLQQSIYVNGNLDVTSTALSPFLATSGTFEIGHVANIESTYGINYFNGYIDQVTISNRAKSSCEILEDASLAAHFTFDNPSPDKDSGPNSLIGAGYSTSPTTGHAGQAIFLNGFAYFQVHDVTCIGWGYQAFSIALWIQPNALAGPLVHVSSKNTSNPGWCEPYFGFSSTGDLVAQIQSGSNFSVVFAPSPIPLSPTWTHVVQTWSSTNGLRLYVNNVLVASDSTAIVLVTNGTPMFINIGSAVNGSLYCYGSFINIGVAFNGSIDDLRIYSRELTITDICTIYNS